MSLTKDYWSRVKDYFKGVSAVWQWLRKRKAYQIDYEKQKIVMHKIKNHSDKRLKFAKLSAFLKWEKTCKKKWGFWPLENPKLTKTPFGIQGIYEKFLLNGEINSPVEFKNLNMGKIMFLYHKESNKNRRGPLTRANQMRKKRFPPLPSKINISFDMAHPNSYILDYLQSRLTLLRKIYNVKEKRMRLDDLLQKYVAYVHKNADDSFNLKQELFGSTFKFDDPMRKEAFRKRTSRILRKIRTYK